MRIILIKRIARAVGLVILIFILWYVFLGPEYYRYRIKENYNKHKSEFVSLQDFLSGNKALIKGNFSYNIKDKSQNVLDDSLNTLLDEIHCNALLTYAETDSFSVFILIYHQEFMLPPYVYLIANSRTKTLKDILFKPDRLVEYSWINKNLLWGTLKWN